MENKSAVVICFFSSLLDENTPSELAHQREDHIPLVLGHGDDKIGRGKERGLQDTLLSVRSRIEFPSECRCAQLLTTAHARTAFKVRDGCEG
jgi:hypothetical protein